jgi:hypothetical protein
MPLRANGRPSLVRKAETIEILRIQLAYSNGRSASITREIYSFRSKN